MRTDRARLAGAPTTHQKMASGSRPYSTNVSTPATTLRSLAAMRSVTNSQPSATMCMVLHCRLRLRSLSAIPGHRLATGIAAVLCTGSSA